VSIYHGLLERNAAEYERNKKLSETIIPQLKSAYAFGKEVAANLAGCALNFGAERLDGPAAAALMAKISHLNSKPSEVK